MILACSRMSSLKKNLLSNVFSSSLEKIKIKQRKTKPLLNHIDMYNKIGNFVKSAHL